MLFSKFQQSWKTKLNISKSTTDPGIEVETFIAVYKLGTVIRYLHLCNNFEDSNMATTTYFLDSWSIQPAIWNHLFQKMMTSQGKNLTQATVITVAA